MKGAIICTQTQLKLLLGSQLMKGAIKTHSDALRRTQAHSGALRRTQAHSGALRGTQGHRALACNQQDLVRNQSAISPPSVRHQSRTKAAALGRGEHLHARQAISMQSTYQSGGTRPRSGSRAHLMREAIRGHQRQLEGIRSASIWIASSRVGAMMSVVSTGKTRPAASRTIEANAGSR